MSEPFDWRRFDRRLYAAVALLFPVIVLIGFARTYYLKFAFGTPPVPSLLVHVHSLVMTLWVGYFISQVWLIRTRNARLHMRAGIAGIVLATAVLIVGFFTAVASAKFGTTSAPPNIPPLSFVIVPAAVSRRAANRFYLSELCVFLSALSVERIGHYSKLNINAEFAGADAEIAARKMDGTSC